MSSSSGHKMELASPTFQVSSPSQQRAMPSPTRRNACPNIREGLDAHARERLEEIYLTTCLQAASPGGATSNVNNTSSRPSSEEEELQVVHSPRFRSRRNAIPHIDIMTLDITSIQNVRNCLKEPGRGVFSSGVAY